MGCVGVAPVLLLGLGCAPVGLEVLNGLASPAVIAEAKNMGGLGVEPQEPVEKGACPTTAARLEDLGTAWLSPLLPTMLGTTPTIC